MPSKNWSQPTVKSVYWVLEHFYSSFFFSLSLFTAASTAHGSTQARDQINQSCGCSLHHNYGHTGSSTYVLSHSGNSSIFILKKQNKSKIEGEVSIVLRTFKYVFTCINTVDYDKTYILSMHHVSKSPKAATLSVT